MTEEVPCSIAASAAALGGSGTGPAACLYTDTAPAVAEGPEGSMAQADGSPSEASLGLRVLALAVYRQAPAACAAECCPCTTAASTVQPLSSAMLTALRCMAACHLADQPVWGPAGAYSAGPAALGAVLARLEPAAWAALQQQGSRVGEAGAGAGSKDSWLWALADGECLGVAEGADAVALRLEVAQLEQAAMRAAVSGFC